MKNIGIVMRKELYRVFSDKKMIFGLFIMPALLVVGLFLLIAVIVSSMMADWEEHEPTVLIYQAPESFQEFMKEWKEPDSADRYQVEETLYHITWTQEAQSVEEGKEQIYSGSLDLLLEFPEEFDTRIETYTTGGDIPDVKTYYNPSEEYSDNAKGDFLAMLLEPYRKQLLKDRLGDLEQLEVFSIDKDNEHSVIQNDNKAQGKIFGAMIPYMITILLFAGAMSLGADSFAGEKERGTMAALLMTPVKRSAIVYGKLFALMILSGLSALVYGGAMIFAVPMLYQTLGKMTGQDLNFLPGQMFMMLVLIVTLVFLYVSLIALCSTFAKNTKEGSTFITPVYMAVMVIGMITMFKGEDTTALQYLIPLYGSTMALKNVFTFDVTVLGFILAALSNLGTGALLAWITSRLFHSEKIMLNA